MKLAEIIMLAQGDPIGSMKPPVQVEGIGPQGELIGITMLLNTVLRILFIIGGVYALFNIVIAGIGFINAGGDPKKVAKAWERIWQSILGLVIIVSSFLIAAIIGIILFGDATALINLKITR